MENWRRLNDAGYEISDQGRVRNPRGVILDGSIDYNRRNGLPCSCRVKIRGRRYFIHRITLQSFKPIPGHENWMVDHIDGDPLNNHISNLRWCKNNQNLYNATWMTTNTYKGIRYEKSRNTWRGGIMIEGEWVQKESVYFVDAWVWRQEMVRKYYDKSFYKQ